MSEFRPTDAELMQSVDWLASPEAGLKLPADYLSPVSDAINLARKQAATIAELEKRIGELEEENAHANGVALAHAMEIMKQVDPDMGPTSQGYSEALLLISSLTLGTNETKLAAALGYDPDFVGIVGSRLRSAGIWKDAGIAKTHVKGWAQSMGFFTDVNVASGDMIVAGRNDDGDPLYSMTEQGRTRVSKMGNAILSEGS